MDITLSELVAALEAAALRPETVDGITSKDLRKATGWSDKRVTATLHILKQQGRLGKRDVYRETLNGRMSPVPAYYLLPDANNPPGEAG